MRNKSLLSFDPHPVRLLDIFFPNYSFERFPDINPPYAFPSLEIRAVKFLNKEERHALVYMFVNTQEMHEFSEESEEAGEEDGRRQSGYKVPLSFRLQVAAFFEVTDFEQSDKALSEFMSSHAPYNIIWPYVRAFLAQNAQQLGLPELHLPLVMKWEDVEDELVDVEQEETKDKKNK